MTSGTGLTSAQDDHVVIGVMGSTGSGKSTFIKLLSGDDTVKTGDGLESETLDIQRVDFKDENTGRKITIVDTPGFDDSRIADGITDTEILKRITKFLLEEYDSERKLSGLIYVQSIANTRFSGQSVRNLRMFKELCGAETYKNVVVLTTFWDQVTEQEGEKRESELQTKFFQQLVDGGATFLRRTSVKDKAHHILEKVLTFIPTGEIQIAKEIREEGKTLEETGAGSVHAADVERLISKHKEEVSGLQAAMSALNNTNQEMKRELAKQKAQMEARLKRLEDEKVDLSKGLESEQEARRKLEEMIKQEREERARREEELKNKHSEKDKGQNEGSSVGTPHNRRIQDELERRLSEEQIARKDAEERLKSEQTKSWKQRGQELAEDLPLVPNLVGKPLLGAFGRGADILSRSKSKRGQ